MKKFLPLIGLFSIITFSIIELLPRETIRGEQYEEEEGEGEHEDGMDEIMKLELIKTQDPSLHVIPTERLLKAQQQVNDFLSRASFRTAGLSWTERGANNIGGRTRAILIDKNDPTGNTVFAGSVGGGIWKCTNFKSSNYIWTKVSDNTTNHSITALAQHPSNPMVMYAGTGEGFYNSDAIKGGGVFKSVDGGNTWNVLPVTVPSGISSTNDDFSFIQDIIVTSNGHIYIAARGYYCNYGGVLKSTNGGSSWTRVIGNPSGTGSACSDYNNYRGSDLEIAANGDLYATTGFYSSASNNAGRVFKSPASLGTLQGNSGQWIDVTPTAPGAEGGFRRIEIACAPSDANIIYALCQQKNTNAISMFYKSIDGGTSWTSVTPPLWCDAGASDKPDFTRGQAWYNLIAAFDPTSANTLYIGGVDMMKSTNGGSNFSQLTQWTPGCNTGLPVVHADFHNIAFMPSSGNQFIVANDGGIYYTADGGSTFTARNTGYNVTQYYAVALHPSAGSNIMLAAAQDNGTHAFSSAGINNVTKVAGGDGGFCFIDQSNPNIHIGAFTHSNYFYSTDGGNNIHHANRDDISGDFINPSDYDHTSKCLYVGYSPGKMGRLKNLNTTTPVMDSVTVTGMSGMKISTVKTDPNVSNRVYIGAYTGAPKIIRIDAANSGSPTYTDISIPGVASGAYISNIDVETGEPSHLLATISNYGVVNVWESTNGGSTWTGIDGNLPDMPVRWGIFLPSTSVEGRIMLATEIGVWTTSADKGTTTIWTPAIGFPSVRVDMLRFRSGDQLIAAATHGRGVFTANLPNALPVNWVAFSGKANDEGNNLTWQASDEVNCKAYEVERRTAEQNRFETIGSVNALNITGLNNYNLNDNGFDRSKTRFMYRIKQIDKDGRYSYSKEVTINRNAATGFVKYVSNTQNTLFVKMNTDGVYKLTLSLFDMAGKRVVQYSSININEQISISSLSSGSYLLKIERSDGQVYTKRIIK